jgi:DNA-binding CsgD family transcriptional regulator
VTSDNPPTAPSKLESAARTLTGRAVEVVRVDGLLRQARTGRSAILVVRGQAGIGKTALLDTAAARADGFRVVHIRSVEAEQQLPYAGLHMLCNALHAEFEQLQPVQRSAIDAAIGMSHEAPDPLLIGLATISLLRDTAAPKPLLCVMDDAQWLDKRSAQVVGFVLRRIETGSVAVLIGVRDPYLIRDLEGLPSLRLGGLPYADSRALFNSLIRGRVDEPVIGRIIAETQGNPGALIEALKHLTADFAGGFGVDTVRPPGLADGLSAQVNRLPSGSRRMLLLAAAEPTGDPALLWRAARELAIAPDAGAPLESAGLLRLSPRVTFRQPTWRAAIYGAAANADRRAVHGALAKATDPDAAPDRLIWHRALAAHGPDEQLARELEQAVPAARERGGPAAAAAFLERSALLTLDPARRAERALTAAAEKFDAGAAAGAARLLVTAELGTLGEAGRARLERQRAQLAFATSRTADAADRLLNAARKLRHIDLGAARESRLEAIVAALFGGRSALLRGVAPVAEALPPSPAGAPHLLDQFLDGLVARFTDGYPAGYRPLRDAVRAFGRDGDQTDADRWSWLAGAVAADLWDDSSWEALTGASLSVVEQGSASAALPYALTGRAIVELNSGDFARATALVAQADVVSAAMGSPRLACASLMLAGWQGDHLMAPALFDTARRAAGERGEGRTLTAASYAQAVLYNGLGRYDAALAAARHATQVEELTLYGWSLIELVEAAARSGDLAAAAGALDMLAKRTRLSGTDWALGIEARSRALLSDGARAEALYREAIERLGQTRIAVHHARAQLLYGEWLRRQGRRIDARAQLGAGRESFVAMGATAFADRAHRECLATGEKARRRGVETSGQLTPQEARIALLARDGLTNPEIGERMFISARTVEYHLHKVFEKVRITSRHELHLVLDRTVSLASPAAPDGWRQPEKRVDVA